MNRSQVCVILPAFNEASYIGKVLKSLQDTSFSYVVVDDGSTDCTSLIAARYCSNVLIHRVNLGKGAALKTGCDFAFKQLDAKAVIFMDSDAQHKVEELDKFYTELKRGENLIFGVREFGRTMPLIRIIGNRLGSYIVLLLFGQYIPDIPSGFKAMTKSMYKRLSLRSTDYGIELEIAAKTAKYSLPFISVPVTTIYHEMDRGMSMLEVSKMIINVISFKLSL